MDNDNSTPSKYKVVVLKETNGKLTTENRELRALKDKEVLVKIAYSTILPSDIYILKGIYGTKMNTPFIPGNEGSGIIVDVGNSLDKSFIGKYVSIAANHNNTSNFHGTWAEFIITDLNYLIVYNTKVELDKVVAAYANPLTVLGFFDTLVKRNVKAVAHNGASSALGRMFLRLCLEKGIEIVNVVRKEQSIQEMKELGGKHFINTSDKNWKKLLNQKLKELNVKVFFECVGGNETGNIVKCLIPGSTLIHFGNLLEQKISNIDSNDLIFLGKKLEGFVLQVWLKSINKEEYNKYKKMIQEDFENNKGRVFYTDYVKAFSLDQAQEALEFYNKEGKKFVFKTKF